MNLLQAINRVLRTNNILRGDDDDIVTLTDVAHNATLNLALIGIQDELMDLVSDRFVNYELFAAQITTAAGTANYSLAPDFVQFYGIPKFTNSNRTIYEYIGGLEAMDRDFPSYSTQNGSPVWWYFYPSTTKMVGFYPTPNAVETYDYLYEKDVSVTNGSDNLPFHNEIEAQAFCAAAARRFKFLFEDAQNVDMVLANDASYISARGRIVRLMKGRNPYGTYGSVYR